MDGKRKVKREMCATAPLLQEALSRFDELIRRASEIGLAEPAAMTLATVDASGQPSARVVLLRGWDARGFVFFTNAHSHKGKQLNAVPKAALCFHWDQLKEQVRIEGTVEPVSEEESDTYWATRSRQSQLGAWASQQSEPLESRAALENALAEVEARFREQDVPRPPHWFGFRVMPRMIEFWVSREARLHERVVYEQVDGRWQRGLRFP